MLNHGPSHPTKLLNELEIISLQCLDLRAQRESGSSCIRKPKRETFNFPRCYSRGINEEELLHISQADVFEL